MELLTCHSLSQEIAVLQTEAQFSHLRVTLHCPQCESPGQASSPLAVPDRPYDIVISCASCTTALACQDMVIADVENCFAVVAGPELARHLITLGHHLLTPGWLANWRERIAVWGFTEEGIRTFFEESQSRFLLLNTGTCDDSLQQLESFASFVGRPFDVLHVGLGPIRHFLRRQIHLRTMQLELRTLKTDLRQKREDLANHTSGLEMLAELTHADSLPAGIHRLHKVFQILFAPKVLAICYTGHGQGQQFELFGDLPPELAMAEIVRRKEPYWLLPDQHGFVFRTGSQERPFAFVCVCGLAFPENASRYLSMALEMRTVCLMALTSLSERDRRREIELQLAEAR